ncbi:MAG TPA: F0F1 ATP synthase subunit B [Phycisphaerales bacterium]|nr:F0F1 ATP synthase subunit B [Phycisphaerales bacterium]
MNGTIRRPIHLLSLTLAILAALAFAPGDLAPCAALAQDHGEVDTHAAEPHGADDHGGAHAESPSVIPSPKAGIPAAIFAVITFGIAFLVLAAKVWPTIAQGLKDREEKIRQEIASAEDARRQAAAALESYQHSLAEARAEAQKMLEETRSQQQALAAELRAKADVELNDIRDKARRDIEAAKRAALAEIYSESVNRAAEMAAKILGREINPSDHRRLVEDSLRELQTASR